MMGGGCREDLISVGKNYKVEVFASANTDTCALTWAEASLERAMQAV